MVSFLATSALTALGIFFGKKIKWKERKAERHIHRSKVLRVGGIAMILAFNLAILLDGDLVITGPLGGVMAATIALMLAGIRDDLREIFWKIQLFYQAAAAIFIFILGVRVYFAVNPLTGEVIHLDSGFGIILSAFLVVFWIVLMINSMNWIDGIDGLSGGVTFIGAMTIFFLSLKAEVNQPPMAILSVILAGASLAFLFFNFNPARVLAGTTGSNFMGFSLAVLAIFAGTKIATSILVMSLPLIDFMWVIAERLKNKKSIFRPDRNHLHHKMLALGWSQKKIALYFYAITILISAVALNTRAIGKGLTLLLSAAVVISALAVISKKTAAKTA